MSSAQGPGAVPEAGLAAALAALGARGAGELAWGWMLGEGELAAPLRFLYRALDANNVLAARDACRYAELEERGLLLAENELEEAVAGVLEQYEGLTLPGDIVGLECAKKQNDNLRERLNLLKKQEKALENLKKQNELAKEDVTHQISELRENEARCLAEVETAEATCMSLAEKVERSQEDLIGAVANNLQAYNNFQPGMEISSKFVISGPVEAYTQNKRLFKSHFKICTSRLFDGNQWKDVSAHFDANYNNAAAKKAEKRLYNSIWSYIDSVADLNAVHKKIEVISNYQEVHSSRVLIATTECLSSVEMLKQDLELLKQRIDAAVLDLVQRQTLKTVSTKARAALNQRKEVLTALNNLHELARQCVSLDALLYLALRRECQRADDLLRFAGDVRDYISGERANIASRIDAMKSVIREHAERESNLKTDNFLLSTLNEVYGNEDRTCSTLVKRIDQVKNRTAELKEEVEFGFGRKERCLEELIEVARPLVETIWDGCTKMPNSCDLALETLFHQVKGEIQRVEEQVLDTVNAFTKAKNKDKDLARKLWQWFLSDPERLRAKIAEWQLSPSSSK